ncbi:MULTISPECIES: shikimate kinase [Brenneria]|uniref:Adenylate kinase n=1 Tax=Brenneria nigrifluens DSM 30175 = ATCC 13028 TaxID=1121120 RepID=A0A2U1UJW8_9GAMM|nr:MULTISPECIES: shikimate kinase [Brenneria]EHD20976.1 shikimate kinase [Brenneria sp. EniD312]PWC21970.1 adenylate kinase [Brenneria nigrifluens] [Brenneria nigrifluens DSM 30175 = ATCC 13028]QCR04134.1 adenylate kinase [Brenneria nigrifluens] [Brenneria nigrifluens DSM 30175 = ATCC 13028]
MKINVIGTSGSGKSTIARGLAQRLGIAYIEMDALFWRENWRESPDSEFFPRLETALTAQSWVLDGNYNRTRDIKWRNVDVVVWVDYGFSRTLFQAISRAWLRSWRKEELWAGTGNRESFMRSFFSRDSIIIWTIKTYSANRKRYLADLSDARYRHIRFISLRSPRESEAFLHHFEQHACQPL